MKARKHKDRSYRGEAGAAGHTDHVGRPQAVRTRSTGRWLRKLALMNRRGTRPLWLPYCTTISMNVQYQNDKTVFWLHIINVFSY
ncbi:hypothetical protein MUK42_20157 [Musa troglodytarum]|uniref:Uncharacterized protein n=1 Tax=Musa troglodytarum TaxID=320322 RepID=A0A9E7G336_9LILI|nr:hypothetical protein MUK42_21426 [Musa troglodytarum]URE07165.1 hypothetical protein MUK42_20157 [Musa troglodytarum]